MCKLAALIFVAMLVIPSGCATENFVKQQLDPLADRIGVLESKIRALDIKLADLEKRPTVTLAEFEAAKNDIADALVRVQQAAGSAQAAGAKAEASVSRLEGVAERAENAAGRAEQASQRAAKASERGQRK